MSDLPAPRTPGPRGIIASAVVAGALAVGAYSWQQAGTPAAADGTFTIAMTDYRFSPASMVWRVGERVTITLVGKSEATPPKPHEFMIGRGPRTTQTVFGPRQEDGFETPFFSGVTIEIVAGSGLQMLMPGEAILTGLSPAQIVAAGATGEMEMRGDMRGFMPLVGPRGSLTFSFIVPDKPGEWTYGCFQQTGQHFLNGMKGTVTILAKSA